MICAKCHRDDCDVMDRLEDYRRDPFAFIHLQTAMITCGVISSYRRPKWAGEQPVTLQMLEAIWDEHDRNRR